VIANALSRGLRLLMTIVSRMSMSDYRGATTDNLPDVASLISALNRSVIASIFFPRRCLGRGSGHFLGGVANARHSREWALNASDKFLRQIHCPEDCSWLSVAVATNGASNDLNVACFVLVQTNGRYSGRSIDFFKHRHGRLGVVLGVGLAAAPVDPPLLTRRA